MVGVCVGVIFGYFVSEILIIGASSARGGMNE